jgi:hypothetical protein
VHTEHVSILLPDFIHGSLGDEFTIGIEEHVRTCASCRTELDELRRTIAIIAQDQRVDIPSSYFTSVLPRVRQRLEEKQGIRTYWNPVMTKLAVPAVTAVLAIALLWHVPFSVSVVDQVNPLKAIAESATPEEFADILREQSSSSEWNSIQTRAASQVLMNEKFVKRQLVHEALAGPSSSPLGDIAELSSQQLLTDLDESDVDEILQRLGKMEIL